MIRILLSLLLSSYFIAAHASHPGDTIALKAENSTIEWTGKKVAGKHYGTIKLAEGSLIFRESVLVGGSFVIDMTTISCADLSGNGKAKLESHLMSDDFFGVDSFPTALLEVKDVKPLGDGNYDILADLTIKGITNPIDFNASVKPEGNSLIASANIIVDRTLYNIRYGSGKFFENLGDKIIYDEFELAVSLVVGK